MLLFCTNQNAVHINAFLFLFYFSYLRTDQWIYRKWLYSQCNTSFAGLIIERSSWPASSCPSIPVVPGPVLSLSTQCIRDCEQVKVLVLCTGQEGKNHDGSLLTMLSLPERDLTGNTGDIHWSMTYSLFNCFFFFWHLFNLVNHRLSCNYLLHSQKRDNFL